MKRNNKGLSLVELIIAVAIFAIVGLAIAGFMSFSSRNYSLANKNVKLQYEQQVVVNRLRDIVLGTSKGIGYDSTSKTLTVLGEGIAESGKDTIEVTQIRFIPDATDGEPGILRIKTISYPYNDDGTLPVSKVSDIPAMGEGDGNELSDSVTDFSVDLSSVGKGKVTINITFKVGDKEIEAHPEITLRNNIELIDSDTNLGDLYDESTSLNGSKVASVVIYRDGRPLTSKTDTIKMAGNQTSADYDAVVTKKSYVDEAIDESVTWEIDQTTVKDGYEEYIILDSATGLVTVKNKDSKTPNDFINGSSFVLKAISNQDPSKIGRVRISVTTGGIYPVSISSTYTTEEDIENKQRTYKLAHSITYTERVKNSSGTLVNPLTGADVFTRIKYTVYEADKTTLAQIPTGAGFTDTDNVDGRFVAVESMVGKTYAIKVEVLQRDKDGNPVEEYIMITVAEMDYPDDSKFTKPVVYTADTYNRADDNVATVQWSDGVPTYRQNGRDNMYYYWYEWEIVPQNGWGNGKRYTFNSNPYRNVYFVDDNNKNTTMTSYMTSRIALIHIEPHVAWDQSFTMEIRLRVKLSRTTRERDALYYKLPSSADNLTDILTSDKDSAYVVKKTITIKPVTLTLRPAEGVVFYKDDVRSKGALNAYFDTGNVVKLGYPGPWASGGYNQNYWEWKSYDGSNWANMPKKSDYYKIFIPEFTGLNVTIFNYENVFDIGWTNGTYHSGLAKTYTRNGANASVLEPYVTAGGYTEYISEPVAAFDTAFKLNADNNLYAYVRMRPYNWTVNRAKYSTFPNAVRWTCIAQDKDGNSVLANSEDGRTYYYFSYTADQTYESR